MQRRFRRAYVTLKEHGCVSYAKIATIGGYCDLDLIVIKATAPDDLPSPERYIHELLKIFSFSPSSFRAFSLCFTRRFGKTQCWRVALKCLVLLHRLLRSLPESSPFRSHLLWCRSNGVLSLSPCHFRDSSSSTGSEDFTFFIRSYARLLDEALGCFSEDCKAEEINEFPESLSEKMKEVGRVLEVLPQLQSIIDRVMECKPTGAAARSFVVRSAMKQIVRDSFICYAAFCRDIVVLLDNLFQMQYRSSISAFEIYKKAAIQAIRLNEFYEWSKSMGLCGSYEYPFVDRIPHIHVRALEAFLNGMWQLTESSSSETETSPSSSSDTPSTLTEDEGDRQLTRLKTVISTEWERFEEDEEKEPLIQLEVNNNVSWDWEALLEASARLLRVPHDNKLFYATGYECNTGGENNGWKIQVYNPYYFNPFNHPYIMYGSDHTYYRS